MKTKITAALALLLLISSVVFAGRADQLLHQLSLVNAQWEKQTDAKTSLTNQSFPQNKTAADWIATHLMLVEQTLRQRDVSALSTSQKANRFRLLDKLNNYRHSRAFPVNDYVAHTTPVFIDRTGNHCAVGYLMQQSGHEALAQEINRNEQFAYVYEIKTAGVAEWAAQFGFTVDELAWIQPGYPPVSNASDLKMGLNGTVNCIVPDQSGQVVYVAGEFTQSTLGTPCNNIAAWISGFAGWDWISLGAGVNGPVNAMILHDNKLYVGGNFTTAGGYPAHNIAVYDIGLGQWQSVDSIESSVYALAFYNNELYAAGAFPDLVKKWNGASWQSINNGFIYGHQVRALHVFDNQLVIGGDFDLATGAPRKNVATYDGTYMGILGMGTPTPVNDFETHEGKLYAACDLYHLSDSCALAVFDHFDWQVVLKPGANIMDYLDGNRIASLFSNAGKLYMSGEFAIGAGMTFGNNLMSMSDIVYPGDTTVHTVFNPLAVLDDDVRSVVVSGNLLYVGGRFITNNYTDTLNHVATFELTPTGISEPSEKVISLQSMPNPTTGWVRISAGSATLQLVEIFDLSGRLVLSSKPNHSFTDMDLSRCDAGVYLVKAKAENKVAQSRIVKQ